MRYFVDVHSYNDMTQLEICSLLRSLSVRKPSKKPVPKYIAKLIKKVQMMLQNFIFTFLHQPLRGYLRDKHWKGFNNYVKVFRKARVGSRKHDLLLSLYETHMKLLRVHILKKLGSCHSTKSFLIQLEKISGFQY